MATRMGQELADQLASAINAAVSQADGNIIQAQDAITEAILAAGTKVIDYEQSIFRAKEGRQQAREVRGAELADLEKNRKESYEFKKDAMRRGRKILHIATALKAFTALGGEALKYWANPPKKVAETKKPGDYVQDQPTVSEDILGKEPLGFTPEERSRYTTAPSFQEYSPTESSTAAQGLDAGKQLQDRQRPEEDLGVVPIPDPPPFPKGDMAPIQRRQDPGHFAPWSDPTKASNLETHRRLLKVGEEEGLREQAAQEAATRAYEQLPPEEKERLAPLLKQGVKEQIDEQREKGEQGYFGLKTRSFIRDLPEHLQTAYMGAPNEEEASRLDPERIGPAGMTSAYSRDDVARQAMMASSTPEVVAPKTAPTPAPVSRWASMVDQAPWTSMVNQAPPSSPPSTAAQGLDAGKQLPPTSEAVAPKAAPAGSALAQEELEQQRALDDAIKASLPPSPVAKEALAQKKDPATEKPIDSPEFSLSLKEDPGESVDSWAKEGVKEILFDPMDLVPFETRKGTPALLPRKFAERLKRFFAFAAEHGITLTLGGQDSGARDSAAFDRLDAKGLNPSREGYHSHKKDHRAVDIEVGGSFNSDEYKFIKEHGPAWGILPGHTRPDQASSESPFKNYRKPWHHIFSVDIPADSPFAPGSDYWKYKSRKNVLEREKNRSATDDELWKLLDLGGS